MRDSPVVNTAKSLIRGCFILSLFTSISAFAQTSCANAIVINGQAFADVRSTLGATGTSNPVPPCVAGIGPGANLAGGVWYEFTAPAGGELTIDTEGSHYDTGLALYTGSCSALELQACDVGSGVGSRSRIVKWLDRGVTYYILAGGVWGETGDLNFHLNFTQAQTVIDFEGLRSLAAVPPGYGGLTWANLFVLDGLLHSDDGYRAGIQSGSNVVASSGIHTPATISSATSFDLISGYFTASKYDDVLLEERAYVGDLLVDDLTVGLSSVPAFISFDLFGIDRVEFLSYSPGHPSENIEFVLDDLVVEPHEEPGPPAIVIEPAGAANLVGSPVSLSVLAGSLTPVTYQWKKDGVNLSDGINVIGTQSKTLKFLHTSASDAGNYSVTVSNGGGSKASEHALLTCYSLRLDTLAGLSSPDEYPEAGLVLGDDGNFYGTTFGGGDGGGADGNGSIFRMHPDGSIDHLISFSGTGGPYPGAHPQFTMVKAYNGKMYGTTLNGGNDALAGLYRGYGTVFELKTDGTVRSIYQFNGINGALPNGLTIGQNGSVYGNTQYGGPGYDSSLSGSGMLFSAQPADGSVIGLLGRQGLFSVAAFTAGRGDYPWLLYGVGYTDQTMPRVFYIDTAGTAYYPDVNVAVFPQNIGFAPRGLTWGNDGFIYGTAYSGGEFNAGSIFKAAPYSTGFDNGTAIRIASFRVDGPEGYSPWTALTLGTDSRFYGITTFGGEGNGGTVFQMTPDGQFTVIAAFNGANGLSPRGTLLQTMDGNFYGTTAEGGANGVGTIFRLTRVLETAVPTPLGQNVAVSMPPTSEASGPPAHITFDSIISPGITTLSVASPGNVPAVPAGFKVAPDVSTAAHVVYFNVTTTAEFSGPISLCLNYNDSSLTAQGEANLHLLHYNEARSQWDDITIPGSLDTVNNTICGETMSLSPFALCIQGVETPSIAWLSPSPITYGTVLNAAQLNATASYNGSSVSGTLSYNPPLGTILPAGDNQTLSVTFTPDDPAQFRVATASVTINVQRAPLTITAQDTGNWLGQLYRSPLNISYSGFVNGDDASVLTSLPVAQTSVQQYTPVGAYPITVSGASAANYDITYVSGTYYISVLPPASGPMINPANGHRYYLLGNSEWFAADEGAKALGGHLVTIRNQQEQDWVYNTFSQYGGVARQLWLGLHDGNLQNNASDNVSRRGEFVWTSGEPVTYSNWSFYEPSGNRYGPAESDLEAYVHMFSPSFAGLGGQWNDAAPETWGFGSDPVPYAELDGVAEVLPPRVLAGPITNPANDHQYFLLDKSDWIAAEAIAKNMGGDLATIRNQDEQDFILNAFANYGGIAHYLWIGLYDGDQAQNASDPAARRNEFSWVSGEPVTYTQWTDGEPNNFNNAGEFWGQLYPSGTWNDLSDIESWGANPLNGVVELVPNPSVPTFKEETPAGTGITVNPINVHDGTPAPVQITFDRVTQSGVTTVTEPPPLENPIGFSLAPVAGGNGIYVDIKTSATFSGRAKICFTYDDSHLTPAEESALRLFHYVETTGTWADITTGVDTTANQVCGETESFSPFTLVLSHAPVITALNVPPGILALNTPVQISATFADKDSIDQHQAQVDWGDGITTSATVDEANHLVSAAHSYTQSGLHNIALTLTDGANNSASASAQVHLDAVPVANPDTAATTINKPISFAANNLAFNDTDPDGDVPTVVSVSAASSKGGTLSFVGGVVTYTPPNNYTGTDTFTYVIQDGRGSTATGTVTVTIAPPSIVSPGSITTQSDHTILVKFPGKARSTYLIQSSSDGSTWTNLGTATAAVTGAFSIVDTSKVVGRAYRAYIP